MRYVADKHRKARKTVCVSTQAGCALGCTFCATGQQGFRRQLTTGEIVAQIIFMQRIALAEDRAEVDTGERDLGSVQGVTNVVFMGMGEPLANYDNSMSAVRSINDADGLAIGARHITLSTVGLVPQILQLAGENIQINLAVSLHAPDDETRSETMPINRRYPLSTLLAACRQYVEITDRRIFFEYVLLSGQNDTTGHARKLGEHLNGMLCHVNLIPVNPDGRWAVSAHQSRPGRPLPKRPSALWCALYGANRKGHRYRCRLRTVEGSGGRYGSPNLAVSSNFPPP